MPFHKATRKGVYALVGITGPSGAGKTYSALLMARGLVGPKGRIAMLDTERGRGSIYANLTDYDVDELAEPFTPGRYKEKIEAMLAGKYDCGIIDSFSHEWEGEGGVLDMAQKAAGNGAVAFRHWRVPKLEHKRLVNRILQAPMHLIICMRGKEKLTQTKDPQTNKDVIVSAGYVPIQESRMIFEMTISVLLPDPATKVPILQKCPDEIAAAFPEGQKITERSGAMIAEWLGGAVPVDHEAANLQQIARDVASLGRDRFLEHWNSLKKAERDKIRPILDELKGIAAETDRLAAEQAEGESEDSTPPEDPFADQHTAQPSGAGGVESTPAAKRPCADGTMPEGDKCPTCGGERMMDGRGVWVHVDAPQQGTLLDAG